MSRMTKEEIKNIVRHVFHFYEEHVANFNRWGDMNEACGEVLKALDQEPIDKSAMMHDIYMEGVNMSGEYQGCWVRFKDIEKIVDKYIGSEEA